VEWVPGLERGRWLAGFFVVCIGAFVVSLFAIEAGLSWAGAGPLTPRLLLVAQLAAIGNAAAPGWMWVTIVPSPIPRLGVSPGGLSIDHGMRTEELPWSRVFLRQNRLDVLYPRVGALMSFRLTPYQTSRIVHLRPALPP
jgi:hypothetical protein